MANGQVLEQIRKMQNEGTIERETMDSLILAFISDWYDWREKHDVKHTQMEKRDWIAGIVAIVAGGVSGMFRR